MCMVCRLIKQHEIWLVSLNFKYDSNMYKKGFRSDAELLAQIEQYDEWESHAISYEKKNLNV